MAVLTIVSEWSDSFGNVYERLSCGHSRRKGHEPDTTSRHPIAGGADVFPDGVVFCWNGCHEEHAGELKRGQLGSRGEDTMGGKA